jgi:hypothetical protein
MRRTYCVLVALALQAAALCLPSTALAATHLSGGTLSTNTTWTTTGSPYVLDGTVTVASGVTLTIDPGVIVKFNGQLRQLIVNGTLHAVGTNSQEIYFTSLKDDSVGGDTGGDGATTGSPGQWLDIELNNSTTSDIEYATIRYGGYGTNITWGAVKLNSGAANFSHDVVTNNLKTGLIVSGSTTSPPYPAMTVDHSVVQSNHDGMYINDGSLDLSGNSDVDYNTAYGIRFNIPNSTGAEPAASTIFHSEVRGNGDWGVYLGVGTAVSDYPHGSYNNIYENQGYVNLTEGHIGQLTVPYVNLSDNWEYNYFGGATNVDCPFGPLGDQIVGDVHHQGPVVATQYLGPPPPPNEPQQWCYGNNVDTLNTSGSLIDNSGY